MPNRADIHRQRQAALLALLRRKAFSTQDALVAELSKRGLKVNQASVSRDLRELAVVKVRGRYVAPGDLPAGLRPRPEIDLITHVDVAGANLVIVRTPAGAASIVAARLDAQKPPEIIGTLAGDDTIFLAVRGRAAQGRVLALIRGIRGSAPSSVHSRDRQRASS